MRAGGGGWVRTERLGLESCYEPWILRLSFNSKKKMNNSTMKTLPEVTSSRSSRKIVTTRWAPDEDSHMGNQVSQDYERRRKLCLLLIDSRQQFNKKTHPTITILCIVRPISPETFSYSRTGELLISA